MPLPSSWRREHEDHDHREDRDDSIDCPVAMMSAEGAKDGEGRSGARSSPVPLSKSGVASMKITTVARTETMQTIPR